MELCLLVACLYFTRLKVMLLFLFLGKCKLWNTKTDINAILGEPLNLFCGNYCQLNGCSCQRQDWLWTETHQDISPVQKIGNQIWERVKNGQTLQNSVCYGHRPRTNLTSDFGILINPISVDDDGLTVCCNTGEILFSTPLLIQCTSISVRSVNTYIDKWLYWMVGMSLVIVFLVVGIGLIACRMKKLIRAQERKTENRPKRSDRAPVSGSLGTNLWQSSCIIRQPLESGDSMVYLTPTTRPDIPSLSEVSESTYQDVLLSQSDETLLKRSNSYLSHPPQRQSERYTGLQFV